MIQLLHPIAPGLRGPVTQQFGEHPENYAQYGYAGHNGVDWGIPVGTPIRAMLPGVVSWAGMDNSGYGNYVKITHAGQISQTLYGHLSKITVQPGQTVKAGDTIGLSGNTGNSTGPHLHVGAKGVGGTQEFGGYLDFEKYLVEALDTGQTTVPEGLKVPGVLEVIAAPWLRLRQGPGTSFTELAQAPTGTRVDATGAREGDWYEVNLTIIRRGWMCKQGSDGVYLKNV